jgi:hypothetical protein
MRLPLFLFWRRSPVLGTVYSGLHVLAGFAIFGAELSLPLRSAALLGLLGSAISVGRYWWQSGGQLRFGEAGHCEWRADQQASWQTCAVTSALAWPFLVLLQLKMADSDNARRAVVILAQGIDEKMWRQARVWLRWASRPPV